MAAMTAELVANGDEDDYFKLGVSEAEEYANSLAFVDVTGGIRHAQEYLKRRYSAIPAAGFLALHKEMPPFMDERYIE